MCSDQELLQRYQSLGPKGKEASTKELGLAQGQTKIA